MRCRLLAAAVLLAIKLVDDTHATNRYLAKVAGIPLATLNRLEVALFALLHFTLTPPLPTLTSALCAGAHAPLQRVLARRPIASETGLLCR